MKAPSFVCILATGVLITAVKAGAAPVFYVDFDNQTDGTYACWEDYNLADVTEETGDVTGMYFVSQKAFLTLGNGVILKTPDGSDGSQYPSTPGPQGGKAILIESGGATNADHTGEGIWVEMAEPYPMSDLTLEAVFWADTNDIEGNIVGIQMILADEWPTGPSMRGAMRILGSAVTGGRGQNIEYSYFTPAEFNIFQNGDTLAEDTWHVAQVVFDYNDSDPATSTMKFYLNGTQKGSTATIDATSLTKVWGTGPENPRASYDNSYSADSVFFIGTGASLGINPVESRGLRGAIDAIAISLEALDPSEFVLPAGYTPSVELNAETWNLYY